MRLDVPIRYSIALVDVPPGPDHPDFPYAMPWVTGGCSLRADNPTHASVHACPTCRAAFDRFEERRAWRGMRAVP